jgi:hypothetical protein
LKVLPRIFLELNLTVKIKQLFLGLIFFTSLLLHGESQRIFMPEYTWNSSRSMAMGGAYIADTQGFIALTTNPAGFSSDFTEITLLAIQADVKGDPFTLYSQTIDGSFSDDMAALVIDNIVENGLGLGANLGFGWVGKHIGTGLFLHSQMMFPQEDLILNASGELVSDIVYVVGYAYDFYFLEDQLRLSVGADVRPMYRTITPLSLDDAFALSGITEDSLDPMKLDTLAGSALAFDMGVIAEYKDFSFAMAVRDIADTRYNMIYTVPEKLANLNFSGTTLGNNFSFITPMSLTLGANWTPDLGDLSWLFRPQFQISYKTPLLLGYDELDLQGYTEQSFLSKLHLGGEIKLYSMLSLRAGLNGGYFTAGTGIDFRLGEFDFAIYSNELGSHSGQQQQMGAVAELRFKLPSITSKKDASDSSLSNEDS